MCLVAAGASPHPLHLPPGLAPRRYELSICTSAASAAQPSQPHFSGLVHIFADVATATNTLWLNVGPDLRTSAVQVACMHSPSSSQRPVRQDEDLSCFLRGGSTRPPSLLRPCAFSHAQDHEANDSDGLHGPNGSDGPWETEALVPLERQPHLERAFVQLPHTLEQGTRVRLSIAFDSPLNAQPPEGFYLAQEPSLGNTLDSSNLFAMTQFQPCGARQAFPCVDQPDVKASFSLRLLYPSTIQAVSNMPIEHTQPLGASVATDPAMQHASCLWGSETEQHIPTSPFAIEETSWTCDTFSTSPPMPAYLVAWAVGKFSVAHDQYTSPLSGRQVPIRVLARDDVPNMEKLGSWAAQFAGKCMAQLETTLGVEYSLPKLDLLAVDNLLVRAMENWGLIIARESILLLDAERAGAVALAGAARIIAHECTHECGFGNLVTMRDWRELWLNEGFATYLGEAVILNLVMPQSQADELFVSYHRARALGADALCHTHAVVQEELVPAAMSDPDGNVSHRSLHQVINDAFDSITYSKSACLLRMLTQIMGLSKFSQSASVFLRMYAFGSATSDDLWTIMGQVSGLDVAKIISAWIHNPGFPVLHVDKTGHNSLTVRQSRFYSSPETTADSDSADESTQWYVPLFLKAVSAQGDQLHYLDAALEWEGERTFDSLPELPTGAVWVLNQNSAGFYRVEHSSELLQELRSHLKRAAQESRLQNQAGSDNSADAGAGSEPGAGTVARAGAGGLNIIDSVRLLEDCTALARAGRGNMCSVLSLAIALQEVENSYPIMVQVSKIFTDMASMVYQETSSLQRGLHRAAASFYGSKLLTLGWTPQTHDSQEIHKIRFMVSASLFF